MEKIGRHQRPRVVRQGDNAAEVVGTGAMTAVVDQHVIAGRRAPVQGVEFAENPLTRGLAIGDRDDVFGLETPDVLQHFAHGAHVLAGPLEITI
jgi:hypothetical protein